MNKASEKNKSSVDSLIDKTKADNDNERFVNLEVDGVAYRIVYEPFFFNEQARYYVAVNGSKKNVFVWDTEVSLFRAIDDEAGVLPVTLEKAISTHLLNQHLQ